MRDRVSGDAWAGRWVARAGRTLLATTTILLLAAVVLGASGRSGGEPGSHLVVVAAGCAAVISGALLAAAALALLLAAQHDTDSRWARVGWGVLVLAAICPIGVLTRAVDPGHPASVVAPLARLVGVALCVLLVAGAVRSWHAPARPVWEGVAALGLVATVAVVLTGVQLTAAGALDGSPAVHVVVEILAAAMWVALAALLSRPRASLVGARLDWRLAAGGMAVAHLLRAVDGGPVDLMTLAAGVVVAGVAAVLARSAWLGLLARLQRERARGERAHDDLERARRAADDDAVRMAGVSHDARNACIGVRAAVETLCRFEHRLDPATAALLREAAISGVIQLESVIGGDAEPLVDVDVVQVAREVAASRRPLGAQVTVTGDGVLARTVPGELARALLNLLVNAERHASGSPVEVGVTASGGIARVVVSDIGPGVPTDVAGRLFDLGAHAAGSPGRGLGLHVARSLARARGGDLRLLPTEVGAAFELTLPLVAPLVTPLVAQPRRRPITIPSLPTSRDRQPAQVG